MINKAPSQMLDKINVRFPDGMKKDIKNSAVSNHRSVNSEILYALSIYLYPGKGIPDPVKVTDKIQSEYNYDIEKEYEFIKSINLKRLDQTGWEILNARVDKLKMKLFERINGDNKKLSDLFDVVKKG